MKLLPIRHGDVVLKPVDSLPLGKTTKHGELTLAYGEVTGHHHTLYPIRNLVTKELPRDAGGHYIEEIVSDGRRFIKLDIDWFLRHQEHHEIKVPAGTYEIGMEREYDPFQKIMRKVVD